MTCSNLSEQRTKIAVWRKKPGLFWGFRIEHFYWVMAPLPIHWNILAHCLINETNSHSGIWGYRSWYQHTAWHLQTQLCEQNNKFMRRISSIFFFLNIHKQPHLKNCLHVQETVPISGAFMSHTKDLNMDTHMTESMQERTITMKRISKAMQWKCIIHG